MSLCRNPGEGSCCGAPIKGLRRLTFPDGTQVGITGLDGVMESLYREGRPADAAAAAQIMERLRGDNYFAPSARKAYEELFLEEYRRLLEARTSAARQAGATSGKDGRPGTGGRGLLGHLKPGQKPAA